MLKGLANPHRLALICHLMEGPRSVGELVERTGLTQSNASQHLAVLRRQGLVATKRKAQTVYYSLASRPVRQVVQVLHRQYCRTKVAGKAPRPRGRRSSCA